MIVSVVPSADLLLPWRPAADDLVLVAGLGSLSQLLLQQKQPLQQKNWT